ncbi:HAUS augmin-like complex subunit 3 [Oxyura jamaicensis]|uniref:HAUS augmin-like complex subunit 3 n=1 Tax=Oxyura jamaicensis TaxID=8884 RepID=UPI0015A5ADA3|nr:HAUS augmin-like complex subunit 3 [Oxyura jamaicensis]XP_035181553.1 HAUS augmin-like complex subunit 3 [Oxyura jamaicensis]XP_035181554.1 HAUS augmin-like complex subunit 3 [Oxyura jamaicensis]XP_035181555.1 HAUS augmin-like complex subunit 3 [Oxyura jamaicensis]
MSCGKDFVETLKKIGYPKADELNGEDFDWMFESSEDRSFLEWFCGNVNEQHVVSEKELQDFNNLLESGKPILEGNALDEVLKTCKPMDSQSQEEEKEELKKLEDELQTLQKIKALQIHRHNKLQLMISENSSMLQALKSKEDEALKDLKEGLAVFTAGNNKLDNDLLSLMDGVKKLASFFTASDSEQGAGSPLFFSQLSLDKYLSQEEQCTAALTSYAKNHFYPGMSELFENLHEDSIQLRDESKPVTCDEANGACEESHEVARLQMAYICAQHQLIQIEAKEESMNSAIQCAESMLKSVKNKGVGKQENLEAKISSLKGEISTIKQHIAHLNNEELPSLLKEHAQLLSVPVVKADLDREIARQDCFASKQDEICSHLLRQKASFELIQLAYEIELKKHKDMYRQLDSLLESLKQSNNELQQRLEVLSELAQPAQPQNTIGPKDDLSRRLYQFLEGENKKQLVKTYKNLQQMAQKLMQDCVAAQDQIAVSSQEQSLLLSKLDNDVNALRDALYCGGNQLLFSSRELTEQFNQLEADLNKLNQLIMDLVADLKSKRNFLESNKLHQMERNLYVYFFKDEDHLKELVEKLEWQSEAKASGLGN